MQQAAAQTPPAAPAPKRKRAAPRLPFTEAELEAAFVVALPKLAAVALGRMRPWRWPEGGAVVEAGALVEHRGRLYVSWACTAIAPPDRDSWTEIDAEDLEQARAWHVAKTERAAQREEARRAAAAAHRIAAAEEQGRIEAAHKAAAEGRGLVDPDALVREVREMSARLQEVEASSLRDAGVYRAGGIYRPGELVTFRNGLWVAKAATTAEPGQAADDWRLVLKAGKR